MQMSDGDSVPISPVAPSRLRGRSVDFPGYPETLEGPGGWSGKRPGESGYLVDVAPPLSPSSPIPSSPIALRLPRNTILSLERTPSGPLRAPSSTAESLDCCLSGALSSPVNSSHQQPSPGPSSRSYDGSAKEGGFLAHRKRRESAVAAGYDDELLKEAILASKPEMGRRNSELISEGRSEHGVRPSSMALSGGFQSASSPSLFNRTSVTGGGGTVQGPYRPSLNGYVQASLRPSANGSAAPPVLTSGSSFVGADKLMDQLSRMQSAMGE